MPEALVLPAGGESRSFFRVEPLLFWRTHLLFVVAAVLDISFTWAVLTRGGEEVNPIAELILRYQGFGGMVLFKFALVTFIIVCTEVVGRKKWYRGRFLSALTPMITMVPVFYAIREMMLTAQVL
jgi:hypothetical protein